MAVYAHINDETLARERRRLDEQASALWQVERALLSRLLLRDERGLMVDMGCGTGATIEAAARSWAGWEFVGLDLEARLLPPSGPRTRFEVVEPADEWPVGAASADAVYGRFVMQHASAPAQLLARARRALKPGGRVMLVDVDDRATLFHPAIAQLDDIFARTAGLQRERGGDRDVGGKLPSLLADAGFTDITYEVLPISGQMLGLRGLLGLALGLKLRQLGEDEAAIEAVVGAAEARPGFVALVPIFVAAASRPAD